MSATVGLRCVVLGCLSRSVAARLNICSKLVPNTTFYFQNTSAVFAWFPTLFRPNLTVRNAARTHLRRVLPWQISLFCGPRYHLTKFGHEVFRHLYISFLDIIIWKIWIWGSLCNCSHNNQSWSYARLQVQSSLKFAFNLKCSLIFAYSVGVIENCTLSS